MLVPFLVAAALVALAYIPFQDREKAPGWTALVKPVCALVLAAYFFAFGAWTATIVFIAAALGDALLTRRGEGFFIAGLVAFLAAHILLIPLLIHVFIIVEGGRFEIHPLLWAGLLLIVGLGVYAYLWRGLSWPLRPAVLIYIAVILAMLWFANVATLTLFIGAVLFAASDMVLAIERFRVSRAWMGPFVWVTYAAALLAFAASLDPYFGLSTS